MSTSVGLMHVEAWRVERILGTGESPYLRPLEHIYGASTYGLPVAVGLFLIFQLFNGLS